MAKAVKKAKELDKWKKKKWFNVLAPKIFQERSICETPAYSPDLIQGRSFSINLMNLTGNIKKQNININFEIDRVQGDTGYTYVKKYEVVAASIKRRVRKGKTRIDESMLCKTKDNKEVRIKPLIITINRISSKTEVALRYNLKYLIQKNVLALEYNALVNELVMGKFQMEIKGKLKKIYPVALSEIRTMSLIPKKKVE